MHLVPKDSGDTRECGWVASVKGGYRVYRGQPELSKFFDTQVGLVPWEWVEVGKVIDREATFLKVREQFPDLNFETSQRCDFCGGPYPCFESC